MRLQVFRRFDRPQQVTSRYPSAQATCLQNEGVRCFEVSARAGVGMGKRFRSVAKPLVVCIAIYWIRLIRLFATKRTHSTCNTVSVIGFLDSASGLGSAGRGVAEAILEWDPRQISISRLSPSSRVLAAKCSNRSVKPTNRLAGMNAIHIYNPDVFAALMLHYGPQMLTAYDRNLAVINWETERLPLRWKAILDCYDILAAPSAFTAAAVHRGTGRTVHIIPNHVPLRPLRNRAKADPHFHFLVVCDALSSLCRKNTLGAVHAFAAGVAQLPIGLTAELIIKCHAHTPTRVKDSWRSAAGAASVRVIADTLSAQEMECLWHETDCLVSLHRSEGFGMPAAEALARGIPVIASRQGGVIDFANDDTCYFVDGDVYEGVDYCGVYDECSGWIEPRICEAAQFIATVAMSYRNATDKARLGREVIACRLNDSVVKEAIILALSSCGGS